MDKFAKLLSIVKKQQLILEKMAQEKTGLTPDNIKGYLNQAIDAAVVNSGISSRFTKSVELTPAQNLGNGVSSEESYMVKISFNPPLTDNAIKEKLSKNFYAFVKGNKPELDGRVSLAFV